MLLGLLPGAPFQVVGAGLAIADAAKQITEMTQAKMEVERILAVTVPKGQKLFVPGIGEVDAEKVGRIREQYDEAVKMVAKANKIIAQEEEQNGRGLQMRYDALDDWTKAAQRHFLDLQRFDDALKRQGK
jgi:hypothetical protein